MSKTITAPYRQNRLVDSEGFAMLVPSQFFEELARLSILQEAMANIAAIAAADATDLATVITLANANKAKINEILASLAASSIMVAP